MDDDWLAANDLLPSTETLSMDSLKLKQDPATDAEGPYGSATIADLRLKPLSSIPINSECAEAAETMRDRGFDQLPVSSAPASDGSTHLVGIVTLGNLLSRMSSGRAHPADPVEKVMFDFRHLQPVNLSVALSDPTTKTSRKFFQITRDTPLSALSRFFEWNSAAVVTEPTAEDGHQKAVAVVTKVDLLTWVVRQQPKKKA